MSNEMIDIIGYILVALSCVVILIVVYQLGVQSERRKSELLKPQEGKGKEKSLASEIWEGKRITIRDESK